jgi:hypothetical protein
MDYDAIRAEIASQGFKRTHETKKLEEFESTSGQVIYLYKEQALQGSVQLMVHPELKEQLFDGLQGVGVNASFPLRSGSNMRRFPKRQSETAANPISYGRSMRAENLAALGRLLSAVVEAPTPA